MLLAIASCLNILTSAWANGSPVELSKIKLDEIKIYEEQFLNELKRNNVSPDVIQKKYLIASKHLSEIGKHKEASYLLKKGFDLVKPTFEYFYIYFSYLQAMEEMSQFDKFYSRLIGVLSASKVELITEDDADMLVEMISTHTRRNNILSTDQPEFIKKIINRSGQKDIFQWNDSIVLARKGKYKSAVNEISKNSPLGHDDNVFKSYLQSKIGQLPKYCLSINSFPEKNKNFIYRKTCNELLKEGPKERIDEKIKETGEIMENTALYEAIYFK